MSNFDEMLTTLSACDAGSLAGRLKDLVAKKVWDDSIVELLDTISLLSESKSENQEAFGANGAIAAVVSILGPFLRDESAGAATDGASEVFLSTIDNNVHPAVVGASIRCIARLCRRRMEKSTANDTNISLLESYPNSLEIIAAAAKRALTSETVALYTCWLVMILASDSPERQFKLVSTGFHVIVIDAMKSHIHDENIAEMSCRAARNIAAAESDIVAKFVEDGICEAIAAVLRWYKDHAVVTEAALWAIVNLSCEENVATILGSVGIVTAVVESASLLINLSGPTLAACSAIRNLSSAGALNYSLFSHTEVCRVVHDILLLHCHPEGYAAVRGSSNSTSTGGDDATQMTAAAKQYQLDHDIAETALWAAANLACDQKLSQTLGAEGIAATIVAVYNNIVPHYQPETMPAGPISEAALWAVINLASSGASNQQALGAAGICEVTAACLRNYEHREGMVEVACNAMYYLVCGCHENVERVRDAIGGEVFPKVIALMQRYIDSDDVCETALKLLVECTIDDGSRSLLVGVGVCKLVVEVATAAWKRKQRPAPEILRLTCEILLQTIYKSSAAMVERLRTLEQLSEDGKARPKGTSFEEVAAAWDFDSLRSDTAM